MRHPRYGGAPPLDKAKNLEHHLGGRVFDHAHRPPFGLSLKLPFFYSYHSALRTTRKRLNLLAMILNVLIPWFLFTLTLALFSFSIRYKDPATCLLIALTLMLFFVGCPFCCIWLDKLKNSEYAEHFHHDNGPMWYKALAYFSLIAILAGIIDGQFNFDTSLERAYDYDNLQTYRDIDPTIYLGSQLPDAGVITFTNDTFIRTNLSMGFKDDDMYCVAPIVSARANPSTTKVYDFWAVGKNCCSGNYADFHCEGYNKVSLHGGLRLLDMHARPYYRLAVQQAESTYHIGTKMPLFFIWGEDPADYIENAKQRGYTKFMIDVCFAFIIQCLIVAIAALVAARVYPMRDEVHGFADVESEHGGHGGHGHK